MKTTIIAWKWMFLPLICFGLTACNIEDDDDAPDVDVHEAPDAPDAPDVNIHEAPDAPDVNINEAPEMPKEDDKTEQDEE